MHDQPSRARLDEDYWRDHRAILDLLLEHYPAMWTLAELDRAVQYSDEARSLEEPSRAGSETAVDELYTAGLIHRIGQFVFAARAAREAGRLSQ